MKYLAIAMVLFYLGCEDTQVDLAEDTEAEVSDNLIVSVAQPNGGIVYFYDMGEEGITIAGTSPSGTPSFPSRVNIADLSATDIYTAAGGDISRMPQRLVDAQMRVDDLSASVLSDSVENAPDEELLQHLTEENIEDISAENVGGVAPKYAWGTKPSGNGCDASWFLQEVENAGWGPDECDCREKTATYRAGGGTWYHEDVHWAYAAVCPYQGRVRLRLHHRKNALYDWEAVNGTSVVAAEGYYAWMSHSAGTWDKDYRMTIAYADAGEAYHRAFRASGNMTIFMAACPACD